VSVEEEAKLTAEAEKAQDRLRRSIGKARDLVRDYKAKLAPKRADQKPLFRFDR
jgi:hypothetical protein